MNKKKAVVQALGFLKYYGFTCAATHDKYQTYFYSYTHRDLVKITVYENYRDTVADLKIEKPVGHKVLDVWGANPVPVQEGFRLEGLQELASALKSIHSVSPEGFAEIVEVYAVFIKKNIDFLLDADNKDK